MTTNNHQSGPFTTQAVADRQLAAENRRIAAAAVPAKHEVRHPKTGRFVKASRKRR
jgi:hypothetical protein